MRLRIGDVSLYVPDAVPGSCGGREGFCWELAGPGQGSGNDFGRGPPAALFLRALFPL